MSDINIIGLTGAARAGKDSVADVLTREHGYIRFAFADELRIMLMEINPMICIEHSESMMAWMPLDDAVLAYGWDFVKEHGGRELLQNLGAAVRRRDPEFWINIVRKQMERDWSRSMVITDCRHLNELAFIRSVGGKIWRIERPGVGPINDHVSEHEWRQDVPEKVLKNDGNLSDLLVRVAGVLQLDEGEDDDGSTEPSTSKRREADEPDRAFAPGVVR